MNKEQELKYDRHMQMYKTVIQNGQLALKSLFIMNGGAAVAMAAFLGKASPSYGIKSLGAALLWFALGTFFACASQAINYFTSFVYADVDEDSKKSVLRLGHGLNVATISVAIFGFISFLVGLFNAYQAFKPS